MSKSKPVNVEAVCGNEVLLSTGGWVKCRYTPRIGARVRVDHHGFVVPVSKLGSESTPLDKVNPLGYINNDAAARETGIRLGYLVTNPEVQRGAAQSTNDS